MLGRVPSVNSWSIWPRITAGSFPVLQELVHVSTLDAECGKVGEYAASATGRQLLPERVCECALGEVVAGEFDVAGAALLGEA